MACASILSNWKPNHKHHVSVNAMFQAAVKSSPAGHHISSSMLSRIIGASPSNAAVNRHLWPNALNGAMSEGPGSTDPPKRENRPSKGANLRPRIILTLLLQRLFSGRILNLRFCVRPFSRAAFDYGLVHRLFSTGVKAHSTLPAGNMEPPQERHLPALLGISRSILASAYTGEENMVVFLGGNSPCSVELG